MTVNVASREIDSLIGLRENQFLQFLPVYSFNEQRVCIINYITVAWNYRFTWKKEQKIFQNLNHFCERTCNFLIDRYLAEEMRNKKIKIKNNIFIYVKDKHSCSKLIYGSWVNINNYDYGKIKIIPLFLNSEKSCFLIF